MKPSALNHNLTLTLNPPSPRLPKEIKSKSMIKIKRGADYTHNTSPS